jgi:cytochrome c
MLDIPGRGVTVLHQRARTAAVETSAGGYGAATSCGSGIVQTSITTGLDTGEPLSVDLQGATLAVDMAADPAGDMLAIVAPGNWRGERQVHLVSLTGTSELNVAAPDLVKVGLPNAVASMVSSTQPGAQRPCITAGGIISEPEGQATAITFLSRSELAIQLREPAGIAFVDLRSNQTQTLDLAQPSRYDTGHTLFHLRAQSGVACASCHPEAGDDGHVWTFVGIGPRRTQSLRGGILGTEPFHWNGDMHDFAQLVEEVFVQRMSGFTPSREQASALSSWIDAQPAYASRARDEAARARGKTLFESDAVGCSGCHTGKHFTDNRTLSVGTGVSLQVPSLRAVSFRTPLMHDGCAASLRDRFGSCGGGDLHGHTSQLGTNQLDDLVAYLETL